MVSKLLCVRELLNVLAAKGEQGELGSDWCSGSWVLRVFSGVRFCDVSSMFWVVFVDGVVWSAVHVLGGFLVER